MKTTPELAEDPDKPITIEVPEAEPAADVEIAAAPVEKPTPEPEKPAATAADDAAAELKAQIADRDRRLAEAAEARRIAEEEARRHEREKLAARNEVQDSQLHIIETAIQSLNAEITRAKSDLEVAGKAGNWSAIADAQMRISVAAGRLPQLESGKRAIEERIEAAKRPAEPIPQPAQPPADPYERALAGLDARAREYLRDRPREWLTDEQEVTRLTAAHWAAKAEGKTEGTKDYYGYIDQYMGHSSASQPQPPRQPTQPRRPPAAPPSRQPPGVDGRRPTTTVTLTPEQREFARIAGVSEAEYASQLLRAQREGAFNRPH